MISNKEYEDILAPFGYRTIETLQDNERTFVAKIIHTAGNYAIFKFAKDPKTVSLKTEEWFSHILEKPSADNAPARGPVFYECGNNWHIREFLKGAAMSEEGALHKVDFRHQIPRLVNVLLYLDIFAKDVRNFSPSAIDDYLSKYEKPESLKHPIKNTPLFTEDETAAYRRIMGSAASSTPEQRLQHGDFAPWHIYPDTNKLVLTDAEHAAYGPRYDDLAFLYMRTWTRGNSPATAQRILNTFLEMSGAAKDAFSRAFIPRIAIHAAQGYHDSFIDWVEHDYSASAHELFRLALQNNLSLLLR